ANLFGTIQRAYDARGGWTSDFMDLRGGSLLRADGGYLIMYSMETISEPGVWRALKRTLNHNRLEIQPLEMFYPFGGSAMKPEPIQISVKVILIGSGFMALRSEEHTSELQSPCNLVCRLLLEKKKTKKTTSKDADCTE